MKWEMEEMIETFARPEVVFRRAAVRRWQFLTAFTLTKRRIIVSLVDGGRWRFELQRLTD